MKTTFRNFLFLLGLTFPFQACHQDPAPEIPTIQAAELEFIGVEHNEKLQDAFQFLVAWIAPVLILTVRIEYREFHSILTSNTIKH